LKRSKDQVVKAIESEIPRTLNRPSETGTGGKVKSALNDEPTQVLAIGATASDGAVTALRNCE
jgi:hypothetical protein